MRSSIEVRISASSTANSGPSTIFLQRGRGSIFAFLGPNGAGKSTTINTFAIQERRADLAHQRERRDTDQQGPQGHRIVFQECTLDTSSRCART